MTAPDVRTPGGNRASAEENTESTAIVAPCADACNERLTANVIAEFAMRGHTVYELAEGGFAVTKWGLVKHVPDLRTLIAFGRQVGAQC